MKIRQEWSAGVHAGWQGGVPPPAGAAPACRCIATAVVPARSSYYVHPQWNFHWGGHLLVLDPGTRPDLAPETLEQSYLWLGEEERNRIASEPGFATCVLPKSNRIVFLDRRALHMVGRIDVDAGDHARISFGGYFLRPDTAASSAGDESTAR